MTVYLSNRDGNGKTNEEGHYKFQTFFYEGNVATPADLLVTQNSPLGLSVRVAAGQYKIDTATYSYTGWLDVSSTVNLPVPNPSNPRIDAVVIYVDKSAPTSSTPPNNPGVAKLVAVAGTAASSPVAPTDTAIKAAIGASNHYALLATVRVGASATQVSNSDITDKRNPVKLRNDLLSPQILLQAVGPLLYPVGSIYTNATDGTNPATLLGFGTWTAYGQGRVLVSVNGGDTDFGTVGKTGGAKTVTLTEAQMPRHDHIGETWPAGEHSHTANRDVAYTDNSSRRTSSSGTAQAFGFGDRTLLNSAGEHKHVVTVNFKGNNQPHTNLQPYITVYMWLRTA